MSTLTQTIVSVLAARRDEMFAPDTQAQARRCLLDWLGCLLAAHGTETGARFTRYAEAQPPGSAPLVGLSRSAAPETAAFYCGALSHVVEMDDVAREAILHPAVVVIPPALAMAADRGVSSAQFLAAIAAGYEVAMLIGEAVGPEHYFHFHNTTTCGVFGAAAAAARVLQLPETEQVWALGNAGTQAFGLWQFNAEGALTKPFHSGRAAAAGVSAALMAEVGISGATGILEGERGFFAGLAPRGDPERLRRSLAAHEPLRINAISIKPYASCRHTHAPVDAALRLRERLGGRLDAVESLTVACYPAALDLCDNPAPATTAEAKFSLQYCVASALLRGSAALADFEPDAIRRPDVAALAARVRVEPDDAASAAYPARWEACLAAELGSGDHLQERAANPTGDPENPLSQDDLEQKFRELARYGGFGASQARGIIEWVSTLGGEDALDLQPLASLRPAAS